MCIKSISQTLFSNSASPQEKNYCAILSRIVAVAIVAIAFATSALILKGIPGFNSLGRITGWSLVGLATAGTLLLTVDFFLKCSRGSFSPKSHIQLVKQEKKTPEVKHDFSVKGLPLGGGLVVEEMEHESPETQHLPPPPPYTAPIASGECRFSSAFIGYDMCVHIASFLKSKDHVRLMPLSQEFFKIMRSNVLWNEYLSHHNTRIWGAFPSFVLKRNFAEGRNRYIFDKEANEASSYRQLQTYHKLKKNGEAGVHNEFFDYIARLMKGGPVAFDAIPQVVIENVSNWSLQDMTAPIVRGVDKKNNLFFAMRLKDTDNPPEMLMFIETKKGTWEQQPNAYWQKNELKLSVQNSLNYVLNLINQDSWDREVFKSPVFKKNLKLI